MPDDPSIESVAEDVEEERRRLGEPPGPAPDPEEASSPAEWTAYAHAKLGRARQALRRDAAEEGAPAGEGVEAGRAELEELAANLPEGRAVSPQEGEVYSDPSLASRVSDMVADLDAALEGRDG